MSKLNIFSVQNLSKRSGISQDILLSWGHLSNNDRRKYFFDHNDSDTQKGKYIRVVKKGVMQKFQVWIGNELKKFDSELPSYVTGGVKAKSILDAINIHIRKKPCTFIKSDIKRFFESIPEDRVFSLFCARFNCDKEVAQIITNCITFPSGPLGSEGYKSLARGLSSSSRVAIWASIQFFENFFSTLSNKYSQHKPQISYYVDDIGISLLTTDSTIIESFMEDMNNFHEQRYGGINFLILNPEKTTIKKLECNEDYVEYLGSRIYMNRKDISIEGVLKSKKLHNRYQKSTNQQEKRKLEELLRARKIYRARIRSSVNKNANK